MKQKRRPLTAAIDDLKKSKLRVTEPRKAILQTLLENHGPFSAEEIHKKFIKKICDLATVYRSLSSLEAAGLVKRCEFGDGTARYEWSENNLEHHHHHVICTECKRVEVLDDCELLDIDRFASKRGFTGVHHSLEFFGVCPGCK
jgi:Fur family ferric uptake transcriptional regulator